MIDKIQENYQTAQISGMAIGAVADGFIVVNDINELKSAIAHAKSKGLNCRVVGGGNNTIFSGERFAGLVIKFDYDFIKMLDDETIEAGAGANWDQVVACSVENGLSGIETLSLVPGAMAGAVVQNIGAYGQQLADTLESVEVLDVSSLQVKELSAKDCQFAYRSSIFKDTDKQPLVILSARLALSKNPTYKRDNAYRQIRHMMGEDDEYYDPRTLRDTVLDIRNNKFPDQTIEPNCGSFFKNPVVSRELYEQIVSSFGDKLKPGEIIGDEADDGTLKIRLAFIFDKLLGLNGQSFNGFKLHESNPLIVINDGGNYHDLLDFISEIQRQLDSTIGENVIKLSPEPDIIKSS